MSSNFHCARYGFLNTLLTISLILVTLLVIGLFIPYEQACTPSSRAPQFVGEAPKASSADYRSIAQLSGYIKYPNEPYLPLSLVEVKQMTRLEPLEGGDDVELTLISHCSELVISLHSSAEEQSLRGVSFEQIYMHEEGLSCPIEHIMFDAPPEYYYACNVFEITCHERSGKGKVTVYFSTLKFEINGNPAAIERGNFSKKLPYPCRKGHDDKTVLLME